ncbi:hypothetical protein MMC30_000069 [Trapelia coarctata]|nr:hypothetical protein [Trapelia coarctata]
MGNERPSTAWSQEDDTLLMRSRAQGMNWAPIAQSHFPKKTPNACRKRHERLMERKNAENWDGVKLEDLARAYVESREMMWKIIADKVGEKWQHVESKCMEKGLKTLQAAARSRRTRNASTSPASAGNDENDFDDSGLGQDPGSDPVDPSSHFPSSHQSSHHQSSHHPSSHHQSPRHQSHPHHSQLGGGNTNANAYQSGPSSHHGNSPSGGGLTDFHSRGGTSPSSFSSAAGYVFPNQSVGGAGRGEGQKLPSFSSGFSHMPGIAATYHPQASYC